jgi:hypothetical protein
LDLKSKGLVKNVNKVLPQFRPISNPKKRPSALAIGEAGLSVLPLN